MAYRVVDSEFNRANYASIIGKTYDSPPAYAQVVEVKGPNECGEVASGVIRVYAVSEALTKGWERLDPAMIAETLDNLKKRVGDLLESKRISQETNKDVLEGIERLDLFNKGVEVFMSRSPSEVLMPKVLNMAVNSIGECVCGTKTEVIQNKPPTRDHVRVEVWEERDRLHIGIQDKESGNYYASWWDEDARQMFEDGFFKSGKGLENSVLEYAEEMGILAK